jgi:hypothetical protein
MTVARDLRSRARSGETSDGGAAAAGPLGDEKSGAGSVESSAACAACPGQPTRLGAIEPSQQTAFAANVVACGGSRVCRQRGGVRWFARLPPTWWRAVVRASAANAVAFGGSRVCRQRGGVQWFAHLPPTWWRAVVRASRPTRWFARSPPTPWQRWRSVVRAFAASAVAAVACGGSCLRRYGPLSRAAPLCRYRVSVVTSTVDRATNIARGGDSDRR